MHDKMTHSVNFICGHDIYKQLVNSFTLCLNPYKVYVGDNGKMHKHKYNVVDPLSNRTHCLFSTGIS